MQYMALHAANADLYWPFIHSFTHDWQAPVGCNALSDK
jgi:hypothetical protein